MDKNFVHGQLHAYHREDREPVALGYTSGNTFYNILGNYNTFMMSLTDERLSGASYLPLNSFGHVHQGLAIAVVNNKFCWVDVTTLSQPPIVWVRPRKTHSKESNGTIKVSRNVVAMVDPDAAMALDVRNSLNETLKLCKSDKALDALEMVGALIDTNGASEDIHKVSAGLQGLIDKPPSNCNNEKFKEAVSKLLEHVKILELRRFMKSQTGDNSWTRYDKETLLSNLVQWVQHNAQTKDAAVVKQVQSFVGYLKLLEPNAADKSEALVESTPLHLTQAIAESPQNAPTTFKAMIC